MCGINGQLRFDGQSVPAELLTKMNNAQIRRGPDDHGIWHNHDHSLGFGHTRLSIIDLSVNGHQPMVDEKLGISLVFNGTIYNYLTLRAELITKGYRFFSTSDTEVIIKAYKEWGASAIAKFDGMFAIALWDIAKSELIIARDRMGIKPLYYAHTAHAFTFASTTKALLNTQVDTSIYPEALQMQLSLHAVVPAPHTILSGIKKCKPGHYMCIRRGIISEHKYWHPVAKRTGLTNEAYLEHTEELLMKAVEKRMGASDVDIGVLLSGGLDSSLIVGLLDKLGHKNINTFSIGFEDIGSEVGSEFEYSDLVVNQFNTNHHKIVVPNSEVLNRLPETVGQMSEPMVAQDAVAFYLLSEQVSKHMKVVLSGQGADEAFCGYFWYPRMASETGDEVERFTKHYIDRPYEEYLQTITPAYHTHDATRSWLREEFAKDNADEFIDKVLLLDITQLIVDDPVKRVDTMTMSYGLEARVPFMDYQLVEHALSMPFSLKAQGMAKYPLAKIARGMVPDAVIDRKKGYFPMPALKYVRGDFLEFMVDILKSQACINRGVYNQEFIDKIITRPDDYMTALRGSRLWHLALLELWLQTIA